MLIAVYKSLFSNFAGRQCRFEPTCSHYAKLAINEHGFVYGINLVIKRIIKCNPFYKNKDSYIFDPVPEKKHDK